MVVNRPLLTELLQLLFAHSVQKLPFSCDEESIVENDRYYYPRWWRKEERDDPLERLATNKVLREQSHGGGKGNSWVGGERGAAGRLARGWDKTLSAQRGAMFPGAVRGGEGPLAALSNWFVVSDTPPPVNEWYNNWVHKQWPMKQFLMQGSEGGCVLCMRYTDLQCTLYISLYNRPVQWDSSLNACLYFITKHYHEIWIVITRLYRIHIQRIPSQEWNGINVVNVSVGLTWSRLLILRPVRVIDDR